MYVHNYKMIAIYLARIPRVLKRKKSKETHSQNSLTDIEQLTDTSVIKTYAPVNTSITWVNLGLFIKQSYVIPLSGLINQRIHNILYIIFLYPTLTEMYMNTTRKDKIFKIIVKMCAQLKSFTN